MSKEKIKFSDCWSEMFNENKKASKGKKHGNVPFSRKKETELAKALMNENDYVTTIVKSKSGEFYEAESRPVAEFRKQFIEKILKDNGIDKQQAEKACADYQFSTAQAKAFCELQRENIEQYLRTGSTWDFNKKPDFAASIKMRDVEDRIVEGRVPGSDKRTKTHEKPHKVIIKKSGTPKYCKEKLE